MNEFQPEISSGAGKPISKSLPSGRNNSRVRALAHGFLLSIFAILYWLSAIGQSSRKPTGFDEAFTVYIARLSTMKAIWAALLQGADNNPPLYYWLSAQTMRWFGDNILAARIPSLMGIFVMAVCVFYFVSRRMGRLFGWIAMLLLFSTEDYLYRCEARPYGVVMGFCGVLMICWQRYENTNIRLVYASGIALAIAGALSTHLFGVLLVLPVIGAELVRSYRIRQIRWPVWIGIALGLTSISVYFPLMKSARTYAGYFWRKSEVAQIPLAWANLDGDLVRPLVLTFVAVTLLLIFKQLRKEPLGYFAAPGSLLPEETTFAAILFLLPIFGWAIARYNGIGLVPRYVLATTVGTALLIPALMVGWTRSRMLARILLLALVVVTGSPWLKLVRTSYKSEAGSFVVQHLGDDVVAAAPYAFLIDGLYGDNSARLIYLSDKTRSINRFGYDTSDRALQQLSVIVPSLRVEHFEHYLASHREFLVFNTHGEEWLMEELMNRGTTFSFVRQYADGILYKVKLK